MAPSFPQGLYLTLSGGASLGALYGLHPASPNRDTSFFGLNCQRFICKKPYSSLTQREDACCRITLCSQTAAFLSCVVFFGGKETPLCHLCLRGGLLLQVPPWPIQKDFVFVTAHCTCVYAFEGTISLWKKKKLQDFCYSGEGFCSAQDLSGRLIFAQLCAGLCANQYSTSQLVRANTQEPDLPSRRGFIPVLWASSFDMGGRE